MKYTVYATRTTVYEIEADDEDDAIEGMMNGEATEVDGNTDRIRAEPTDDEADA